MEKIYHTTKWLRFLIRDHGQRKTLSIEVVNTASQHLGWISWYSPWRQYVFDPTLDAPTTFNNSCLEGIVNVLTRLNEEQRAKRNGSMP